MALPLVTVVTPSYNQGSYIRATIESVLSQNYPNLEYIIMDGASTDETASIVREYSSRLTFISEPDRGQSHAINKGFQRAKGEFVSWLNSDDYYLPGAIAAAAQTFRANPTAGAVFGEGYLVDRDGNISTRFPHTEPTNLWKLVHLSDYILQQTVFFKRDIFNSIGYLDESLHYTMDWDILIRIARESSLVYIPEFMGCLREYAEAKSSAGGHRRAQEIHALLRRHTGRRIPPGSLVYGTDTYCNLACEWLDSHLPHSLNPFTRRLRNLLRSAADHLIGHTIKHSQGLYPDNWASNRLHFMLPSGGDSFLIEGRVPEAAWRLRGQTLSVYGNGTLLGRRRAGPDDFRLQFDVPAGLRNVPLHLRIDASRFHCPTPYGVQGLRRLAFELKSIDWIRPPAAPGRVSLHAEPARPLTLSAQTPVGKNAG